MTAHRAELILPSEINQFARGQIEAFGTFGSIVTLTRPNRMIDSATLHYENGIVEEGQFTLASLMVVRRSLVDRALAVFAHTSEPEPIDITTPDSVMHYGMLADPTVPKQYVDVKTVPDDWNKATGRTYFKDKYEDLVKGLEDTAVVSSLGISLHLPILG